MIPLNKRLFPSISPLFDRFRGNGPRLNGRKNLIKPYILTGIFQATVDDHRGGRTGRRLQLQPGMRG